MRITIPIRKGGKKMRDVPLTAATPDVLIVGAGPVGLALANDLLRRGIRCHIIDRAEHPEQKTNAMAIPQGFCTPLLLKDESETISHVHKLPAEADYRESWLAGPGAGITPSCRNTPRSSRLAQLSTILPSMM